MAKKHIYYKRQEQGLCVECGKENPEWWFAYCWDCRERVNTRNKEATARFTLLNICPRCRREKVEQGKSMARGRCCLTCRSRKRKGLSHLSQEQKQKPILHRDDKELQEAFEKVRASVFKHLSVMTK